ncbi:MAG: transposase, partial [Anaerolineae bacterium]
VDAHTKIAWRGKKLLLRDLAVKPGQVLWLEGVTYRPEGRPFERGGIGVNLVVSWQRSAEEPWYVVTTLESAEQALAYYRRRMRIEECFRDWKQRLGLRQAAVSTMERMARLVAGLVLATLVLALLGLLGLPAGFRRAVLGRGKGSWLWLALQLLEQARPPELGRALRLAAK